jgi:hypothetical protein
MIVEKALAVEFLIDLPGNKYGDPDDYKEKGEQAAPDGQEAAGADGRFRVSPIGLLGSLDIIQAASPIWLGPLAVPFPFAVFQDEDEALKIFFRSDGRTDDRRNLGRALDVDISCSLPNDWSGHRSRERGSELRI